MSAARIYEAIEELVAGETKNPALGKAVRAMAEAAAQLQAPVETAVNHKLQIHVPPGHRGGIDTDGNVWIDPDMTARRQAMGQTYRSCETIRRAATGANQSTERTR